MPRVRFGLITAWIFVVSAAAGCVSAGQATRSGPIEGPELDQAGVFSVYDAVRLLRPSWLRNLQGGFRNNQRLSVDDLRDLAATHASRIELVSASEARARWGVRSLTGQFLEIIPRAGG